MKQTKNLVTSGMCVALAIVLPIAFHMIPDRGKGFPAYAYSGAAVRAAVRAGVRLGMRYFSAAAFPSFYGNAAHCDVAQHAL